MKKLRNIILLGLLAALLSGLEATRLIKQTWPAIRVVLLTMYSINKIDALRAGADAILLKGGNPEELEAAIVNRI